MKPPADISFEDTIRERIDISIARVKKIARDSNLTEFEESITQLLVNIEGSYVSSRITELARETPPDRDLPPHWEYAELFDEGDDGWPEGTYDELFKREVGQPGHVTLLEIHDRISWWWDDLPPNPGKKRRNRWAPIFLKIANETVTQNDMATLFLEIAKSFDWAYSARNCHAIIERVKNRRRSPEGQAKLRERRRKAAAKHRQKKQNLKKKAKSNEFDDRLE
jgi:hypothetical protein